MQLELINGSTTWHPPASWQADGPWLAALVLSGECQVQSLSTQIQVPPCHILVVPTSEVIDIQLQDGTCLVFQTSELSLLTSLSKTPSLVNELDIQLLVDVFLDHRRPLDHQRAVIALLCHQLANRTTKPKQAHHPLGTVELALAYMEDHLDEPFTQSQLLNSLNCSRTRLHNEFRKAGYPSPMQALASLRVAKASEWLEKTDWTISQIAAAVSYNDLPAFSHFFKKHTGQSPTEFRQNFRWLL